MKSKYQKVWYWTYLNIIAENVQDILGKNKQNKEFLELILNLSG